MTEPVIISKVSERQQAILAQAAEGVAKAQQALTTAQALYRSMVVMGMPDAANDFDPKTGLYLYREPPKPELVEEVDETAPLEDTDED